MKPVDLSRISYKHRFQAATLLVSKANRLAEGGETAPLRGAVAYYDMALALTRPFDPNYPTVINWKCLALIKLEQFEEAVDWYREILRIAAECGDLEGPMAALAREQIARYEGQPNYELPEATDLAYFEDPPFCMHAEKFCNLLAEGKFKVAASLLSAPLRLELPLEKLKADWRVLVGKAGADDLSISLERHLVDWPERQPEEIGWCYFSVSGEEFSEALSLVIAKTPQNAFVITQLEFGRP